MLLLVPLALALCLSLLTGGSVKGLETYDLRGLPFFVVALSIQVALYLPPLRSSSFAAHWGGPLYVGGLSLALVGALRNRRLGLPLRVATLGLALNLVVIAANGGHMPVNLAAMRAVRGAHRAAEIADTRLYGNTRPATARTRLVALSDVMPLGLPGGPSNVGNVFSVGDVLLVLGASTLVYRATRPRRGVSAVRLAGAPQP